MTLISLQRAKTQPAKTIPITIRLRNVTFERVLRPGALEGGVLNCTLPDGARVTAEVAMTWDALSLLRLVLAREGIVLGDYALIRDVLSYWGAREFVRRLSTGASLPDEGLVLDHLGGPAGSQPLELLWACGLLPRPAA